MTVSPSDGVSMCNIFPDIGAGVIIVKIIEEGDEVKLVGFLRSFEQAFIFQYVDDFLDFVVREVGFFNCIEHSVPRDGFRFGLLLLYLCLGMHSLIQRDAVMRALSLFVSPVLITASCFSIA